MTDDIRRILIGNDQYVNLSDLIRFCESVSFKSECEDQICEAMKIIAMSLSYSFIDY